jgi:hypothetical protein
MMTHDWTVEHQEGATVITPVSADILEPTTATRPAGSITTVQTGPARTPMEIMRTSFEASRQIIRSRMTDNKPTIVGRSVHVHRYTRLCKKKVRLTLGRREGHDYFIQRECVIDNCGDRVTIGMRRKVLPWVNVFQWLLVTVPSSWLMLI